MSSAAMKYNPAFRTEEELVRSFVVRHTDLELILEVLRDCAGSANQHQLVVGPRGSGKTTLVRRVAAEVRRGKDLASKWYPVVFSEEAYAVGTPGEFWLEPMLAVCPAGKWPLARSLTFCAKASGMPCAMMATPIAAMIRKDWFFNVPCLGILSSFWANDWRRCAGQWM